MVQMFHYTEKYQMSLEKEDCKLRSNYLDPDSAKFVDCKTLKSNAIT